MGSDLLNKTEKDFESIKHMDENGVEFWYARELRVVLEYKQWRRFEQVIERAKEACKNSNISIDDHFASVGKIVKAGVTNISLFLPSLEWSFTIIVPTFPFYASSIISINADLVKLVPEYPSSTKNLVFRK